MPVAFGLPEGGSAVLPICPELVRAAQPLAVGRKHPVIILLDIVFTVVME
jgi:hypothetical protein